MTRRLLTLDCVGTVFNFRRPPVMDYIRVAKAHNVVGSEKLSPDFMFRSFSRSWKEINRLHPNFGAATGLDSKDWWLKVVHGTFEGCLGTKGNNEQVIENVFEQLYSEYSDPSAYGVYEDALKFIKAVRENHSGLKMGLITNFDKRIIKILDGLQLSPYFNFAVYSEKANSSKPEKRIFSEAMSCYPQFKPEECLHVGDDLRNDYEGALKAGWKGKLINRSSMPMPGVPENDLFIDFNDLFYSISDELVS